jgi:hypothetical protein
MIYLKQHDTARYIEQTLLLGSAPINLTGCTVQLVFRRLPAGDVFIRTAEVVAPASAGIVRYLPVAEDVSVPGEYDLEWVIAYPDGSRISIPTRRPVRMTIQAALA